MVIEYNPNSQNVIVLEDDVIGVAFWLERLLSQQGYNMEHHISINGLLQGFRDINSDFVKIILDNQVPRFQDSTGMEKNGGLEVASRIINKYKLNPEIICLHSRTEDQYLDEVLEKCNNLGIQYIPKKDAEKLEAFLQKS